MANNDNDTDGTRKLMEITLNDRIAEYIQQQKEAQEQMWRKTIYPIDDVIGGVYTPAHQPIDVEKELHKYVLDVDKKIEEVDMTQIKTMRDARGKHYQIFPGKDTKARGEKEAVLKYIENLGVQTHTDVSEWPLSKFMPNGKIILSRPKINKIFFELQKESLKPMKLKAPKISEINKLSTMLDPGKEGLLLNIENYKGSIRYRNNQKKERERQALAIQRQIESDEKALKEEEERLKAYKPGNFSKALKEVLKTGNFMITKDQPTQGIYLMTKEIKKTFFDKKQATNLFVNFGQFKLWVYPGDRNGWHVSVMEGKNNITTRGYLHPHVQGAGRYEGSPICFGEVSRAINEANKKNDFVAFMSGVWDVLQNFEDRGGDGYISLHEFEETQKRLIKEGKIHGKEK